MKFYLNQPDFYSQFLSSHSPPGTINTDTTHLSCLKEQVLPRVDWNELSNLFINVGSFPLSERHYGDSNWIDLAYLSNAPIIGLDSCAIQLYCQVISLINSRKRNLKTTSNEKVFFEFYPVSHEFYKKTSMNDSFRDTIYLKDQDRYGKRFYKRRLLKNHLMIDSKTGKQIVKSGINYLGFGMDGTFKFLKKKFYYSLPEYNMLAAANTNKIYTAYLKTGMYSFREGYNVLRFKDEKAYDDYYHDKVQELLNNCESCQN